MSVRGRSLVGGGLFAMVAVCASPVAAQSHTEVMVGGGVAWASDGRLASSFQPILENAVATGGSGGQALSLDPRPGGAVVAAIRRFFTPHWGIEARLHRANHDVTGDNPPYGVELDYVAMIQGPTGATPTPTRYAVSTGWPETRGELDRLVLSASVVGRVRRGRVALTGSGGAAWQRADGHAESLGYTAFTLGGRSVLFVSDYRVSAQLDGRWKVGVQGAGEVGIDLNGNVAVVVGVQVANGGDLSLPARVRDVLGAMPAATETLDRIRSNLSVGPARVPFATGTVYVGVSVR